MYLSRAGLAKLVAGAALVALAGCASKAAPEYATKSDLQALRTELMTEIRKAQDSANAASQQAAQAAQAAQQAAAEAQAASQKADSIFKQSLRK
ncbi:MAG: hypothetical protein IRY94_06210 [Rhodospirillaceae bacterium]|nr:hypothetical protein [Rhodospirillaceae bacterium]